MNIQDEGGTKKIINNVYSQIIEMLPELNEGKRVKIPISELFHNQNKEKKCQKSVFALLLLQQVILVPMQCLSFHDGSILLVLLKARLLCLRDCI